MGSQTDTALQPSEQQRSVLQKYYAARALEYDEVYRKPERQTDLRAIEQWLPSNFVGKHVLEVACGTGYWTRFIAPLAAGVTAIDAAFETLDIAVQRVTDSKVDFLLGDAYALPQRAEKYDAAFAGFWFSHVPRERQTEFLSGLNARLKTGAKVVILDNHYVHGSSSAIVEQDAWGNTFQTRVLADGTTHRVLKNFPSEAELTLLVKDFGKNINIKKWHYFWSLEYELA